ncbi:helix-turn-helix transcriptional regulator, partial [Pseudonocardia sp. EV170527-09]|uniref:helix-turn-helix domain-containing protein n=1 Tax=Pseudonocardia sp. EV170527-09 TaxID=2603411 RepID=UPI0011F405FC
MDEKGLSRLPERQKEVLRLVFQNYEAKQIARAIGISPHTVNDHMRAARRTLGVARTMDAARLLANY